LIGSNNLAASAGFLYAPDTALIAGEPIKLKMASVRRHCMATKPRAHAIRLWSILKRQVAVLVATDIAGEGLDIDELPT